MSSVPETSSQVQAIPECAQQVQKYGNTLDQAVTEQELGYAVFVLWVLLAVGYPFWLRNYTLAAHYATGGDLNQTAIMAGFMLAPLVSMLFMQQGFNDMTQLPAVLDATQVRDVARTAENRIAKKAVSAVALVAVCAFVLFIVGLVALVLYAGS